MISKDFFLRGVKCHYCVTKGFNSFPNKPWCLQDKSFENTVGKGEIVRNEQFLLFPQCFLPFWRAFCHFHQFEIVVCKLLQLGKVLNLGKGFK